MSESNTLNMVRKLAQFSGHCRDLASKYNHVNKKSSYFEVSKLVNKFWGVYKKKMAEAPKLVNQCKA